MVQMRANKRPGDAQANNHSDVKDGFNGFGDFDDLPSVKSRDLMSNCESASDAKSLATPGKVQRTPRNAAMIDERRYLSLRRPACLLRHGQMMIGA